LYRFVLWDLDNTLLDPHPPERASIRNCFRDFNLGQCTDSMLDTYPAINNRWWTMCERGEKSKDEILVGRFVEFLGQFGLRTDIAAEFAADYMERLGDTICPIDGAMETLKALRGHVGQYLVTNGVWASQRKKVHNSGLDEIMDGIFVSEDIGYNWFSYPITMTGDWDINGTSNVMTWEILSVRQKNIPTLQYLR